ncbi:ROK family protein [Jiangella aurantiaca]|uniref:ROK family protein n=1 Tax=Jiangella aurantiaca TaxID=2530373 RepID=UPI0013A5E4C9|nr:ROK family protein [Jiangella aurantiaca]
MTALLGIDYGGTHTKVLLAHERPSGLERVSAEIFRTPRSETALSELAGLVRGLVRSDRPSAFGMTVAGILDDASQTVVTSTNTPWLNGRAPARELAAQLGAPGVAVHDGAAAATAEAIMGAGRGRDDIFVLALGTGIAGAHVINGSVRRGAHGAAGEIGHVAFGTGRRCSCGQYGCLESEIGGTRLGARWDEERGAPPGSTARDVVDAARAGDAAAVRVLDAATSALAQSLLGVVALIDPGAIVIGGGLARSPKWIVEPAVAKATERATFHRLPPIMAAELGVWAGAWGAVLAARAAAGGTNASVLGQIRRVG